MDKPVMTPQERREAALAMARDGLTRKEIAVWFGVSVSRACQLVNEAIIRENRRPPPD